MLALSFPFALALLAAPPPAAAPMPWDGPPFSGDPAAIARAAAALPRAGEAPMDVLLEEGTYVFDARGRLTETQRLVYRPLTREAAESWAETSAAFAPWHQERPDVRARVVTKDGKAHLLDPSTLVEGGTDGSGDGIYTDMRMLRAPLPALGAGVVVEEVATVRDVEPFFDAGAVHRFYVARPTPARLVRLRVEAPASMPLRHVARGVPGAPRETVEGGRRVLLWEWSPPPVPPKREPFPPREAASTPHVAFSTGESWKAVATRYAAIVDGQLAGADLAAAAREAAGGAATREEAAQRVLDWVAARVRYTGLELGKAAIVPVAPAETLKRHYGDCKDLSLLVAGMLRALGHPATLALVRTEWDELPPELPGLGEFDHAIVFVPGRTPLWIDPTDPATPVGELPPWDQGRLALVTARDTRAPVRTPEAAPGGNRLAVTRDVTLSPEEGWARATEVRQLRGAAATEARRSRRGESPDDRKKSDERLALERLAAQKFLGAVWAGLDRPGAPVEVRLEAEDSRWGVTRANEAEAAISPRTLFACLPSIFTPKKHDDENGGEGAGDEPPARRGDLLLPQVCAGELRYRVAPPPGFRPRPLPAGRSRTFGPARFETSYSTDAGGTVTIVYRFDVSRRRLAPAEADALRTGVAEASAEEKIQFERTSAALLEAGRGRDALAEIRRLADAEPKVAAHHVRLALALLKLGMGEAARREARRAVELGPGDGWPHRVLAHVSAHDLVGRWMEPGCDLPGAIAAQRRAAELEPDSPSTNAFLAFLLEHGERCERGGPGARPDEAVARYRHVREKMGSKDHDAAYLSALLDARRYRDAAALARDMKGGAARDAGLLAAAALTDGADAAAREAARLAPADRGTAVQGAMLHLVSARAYDAAARLARSASAGAPNAAQLQSAAAILGAVRKIDASRADPADPALVPLRLMRALVSGGDPARLAEVVAPDGIETEGAGTFGAALIRGMRRQWSGVSPEALLDVLATIVEVRSEGEGPVRRLHVAAPNAPPTTFYAALDGGVWRVFAAEDDVGPIGDRARALVDAGDLASARRVLAWAREAAESALTRDAADDLAAASAVPADAGADSLRIAAAAVEGFGRGARKAVPVLEAARDSAPDPARRAALERALATAYRNAGRCEAALPLSESLLSRDPSSRRAFEVRASCLLDLGRTADLRRAVDARLRASPDDADAVRTLVSAALRAGDTAEVRRQESRIVALGKAEAGDYNNLAWMALFAEPVGPDALADARKAVQLSNERVSAYLHTLAAVHAASGEPAQALEVLVKAIERSGAEEPAPHDWLVLGRIAEAYGLRDDAVTAYRRVVPSRPQEGSGSHVLAAARLEKLGARR